MKTPNEIKTIGDVMQFWYEITANAGIDYTDYLWHLIASQEIIDNVPEAERKYSDKLLSQDDWNKILFELEKYNSENYP